MYALLGMQHIFREPNNKNIAILPYNDNIAQLYYKCLLWWKLTLFV